MINILTGSIILAIWCVTLFFGKSVGLSAVLFALPFTCFVIYLLHKNNKIINKNATVLIIPITILSATYCIYNNYFFNSLNISVIPILTILMILGLLDESFSLRFGLVGKVLSMIFEPISFIGENFEKIRTTIEEKLKINLDNEKTAKRKKIIRAVLITLPIVLVILMLLSSADEIFGNIFINIANKVGNIFMNFEISTVIAKLILIFISSVYFICFFDFITYRYEVDKQEEKTTKAKDNFTIKMILTSLNVIYFVFCIIQIKSLFLKNVSINYADYARKGFFQLMIVSLINLVTILVAKNYNKNAENKTSYINAMSIIMIVFTFIILLSSAYRMYLYESAYGYTLLRLLVYCSLFTESILLIPTIIYIIDKPINLPKMYFIIVTVIYVCMNLAIFDKIIAKRNVDRYFETGKIDLYYLEYAVNTDAVEEIARVLDRVDEDENRTHTERILAEIYNELNDENTDFRDYNYSKTKAKKIIEKLNNEKILYDDNYIINSTFNK